MLSLQLISLGSNPLSSPQSPTLIRNRAPFSQQLIEDHEIASAPLYRRRGSFVARAVDKRDQSEQFDYEIDEDKAREALEQLDRKLQSLSRKRERDPAPKMKVPEVEVGRSQMLQDEAPELTGSFLAYSAVALLFFSIFYNVLFYGVIKPSIDGPNSVTESETPLVRTEIRF